MKVIKIKKANLPSILWTMEQGELAMVEEELYTNSYAKQICCKINKKTGRIFKTMKTLDGTLVYRYR